MDGYNYILKESEEESYGQEERHTSFITVHPCDLEKTVLPESVWSKSSDAASRESGRAPFLLAFTLRGWGSQSLKLLVMWLFSNFLSAHTHTRCVEVHSFRCQQSEHLRSQHPGHEAARSQHPRKVLCEDGHWFTPKSLSSLGFVLQLILFLAFCWGLSMRFIYVVCGRAVSTLVVAYYLIVWLSHNYLDILLLLHVWVALRFWFLWLVLLLVRIFAVSAGLRVCAHVVLVDIAPFLPKIVVPTLLLLNVKMINKDRLCSP